MSDWCVCGRKANVLCSRCRNPTCSSRGDITKHHYTIANIQIGHDLWIDLEADGAYLVNKAICPDCLPDAARDEYKTRIRPEMGFSRLSPFENACMAARYNRFDAYFNKYPNDGSLIPNDPQLSIMWGVTEWRCGAPTAMSPHDFGQQFATAARARNLPSESVKVGRFRHVDMYKIRSTNIDGWGGDTLVGVKGTLYEHRSKSGGGFDWIPWSKSEQINIPTGSAEALSLTLEPRY